MSTCRVSKLVIFCSFSLNLPGRKNTNLHSPLGMLLLLLLKPSWRLRLLLWLNVRFILIMNGILGKNGIFPSRCCMSGSFYFPHLVLMWRKTWCSMCRMLTSVDQSWKQFRSNKLRFLDATCQSFLVLCFAVLLMILSRVPWMPPVQVTLFFPAMQYDPLKQPINLYLRMLFFS